MGLWASKGPASQGHQHQSCCWDPTGSTQKSQTPSSQGAPEPHIIRQPTVLCCSTLFPMAVDIVRGSDMHTHSDAHAFLHACSGAQGLVRLQFSNLHLCHPRVY